MHFVYKNRFAYYPALLFTCLLSPALPFRLLNMVHTVIIMHITIQRHTRELMCLAATIQALILLSNMASAEFAGKILCNRNYGTGDV